MNKPRPGRCLRAWVALTPAAALVIAMGNACSSDPSHVNRPDALIAKDTLWEARDDMAYPEMDSDESPPADTTGDFADVDNASADDTLVEQDHDDDGDVANPDDLAVPDDSPFPPYPEPLVSGQIERVDNTFWQNMDDFIFTVARPRGLRLYVALFDANFFNWQERRALGRDTIRHPESFFNNALVPFLDRYADSGVLWAIDCLNEPEAMTAGADANYEDWGVTWAEMRAFLAACADYVHLYSDLPVSAGSGWHGWDNVMAGRYSGLGFDFFDFHRYSDAPDLPSATSVGGGLPVIVGECGQATSIWDDTLQLEATLGCFDEALAGGYQAALSWYYDFAGSTNPLAHLDDDGSWRPVIDAFTAHASTGLQTGINLAWFEGAYMHDFGPNPNYPTWTVAYDHATADAAVADLQAQGIDLMRLWLWEGQEALPYDPVFADFEDVDAEWQAEPAGAVSVRQSLLHGTNGSHSLAIDISATTPGWYGIARPYSPDAPLNLALANLWTGEAFNDLGTDVGINLAFTTTDEAEATYQTRPGPGGGQRWLAAGTGGNMAVSLDEAGFASRWALDTAPGVGVARPDADVLQTTTRIRVRVYLDAGQLPINGTLYLDDVRIRH